MSKQEFQFHSCNFCNYTSPSIQGFISHMESHEIKEDKKTIMGRGENTLVQILKEKLPSARIYTKIHLKWIVPYEEVVEFSQRQTKEIVDVLVIHKKHWIVFRILHRSSRKYFHKGHLGNKLSQADLIQKRLIQRYHGKSSVIDLRESECATLFENKNNWYSQSEVGVICMLEGIHL